MTKDDLVTILTQGKSQLDKEEVEMAVAVVRSLAVGLFALQVQGILRFPAGCEDGLTIGEIESKLMVGFGAFAQKLIEIRDGRS